MELIERLQWRYAAKKMDPTKAVPQEQGFRTRTS